MSLSSDSDEFYDAEEITPTKINTKYKTKGSFLYENENVDRYLVQNLQPLVPSTGQLHESETASSETIKDAVELTPERSFADGRKRFRELRQCMQVEDDEYGPSVNSTPESQTSSAEGVFAATSKTAHPFRVIEHDTMSLQSLTSLGRIGRMLSGNLDPSGMSLGRDSLLCGSLSATCSTREQMEEPIEEDQHMEACGVITMQEPDVIASTKANSLKYNRTPSEQTIMTTSQVGVPTKSMESQLPVAPPRRKRKLKSTTTQPDTGQMPLEVIQPISSEKPALHPSSLCELLNPSCIVPLTSPASTIESLTREFQHSLDLSNMMHTDKGDMNVYKESLTSVNAMVLHRASPISDQCSTSTDKSKSETSSRSSTIKSVYSHKSGSSSLKGHSLDIKAAVKGQYVVKPQDEEKNKAQGPTKADVESMEKLKMEFINMGLESRQISHIGHSSLGASIRTISKPDKESRERRKSAGDEEILRQMNMYVRTRTDSGKPLTDLEILEQVTVLNLDTGERIPLSVAEDKLPQCINPLSLHIMRLTSEYVSNSSLFDDDKHRESDDENTGLGRSRTSLGEGAVGIGGAITADEGNDDTSTGGIRRKTAKLKRFLGSTVKKTMDKAKSFAAEVSHARHKEDVADIVDEVRGEQNIKLKASNSHKGPYDFDGCIRHVQEFTDHIGPVWCMKFSQCGRLLATAGQDKVLRIWVIRDAYIFFKDMRTKYNADQKSSPTPSQDSLVSQDSVHSDDETSDTNNQNDSPSTPFMPKPFCTYTGHTSDLLDVSWSKNYFVLSSSMDKTVRLWHISRRECLCCFQHIDFVTAIAFHPRDDRYFLSGSLDGKIRLWNIPDKKVAVWNELDGQTKLITAANFCQNGKFAVIGSYDGRCIFYTTDQLKYHTQIDVRSTRGKNSTGRKISGIEPMPGEDKILVTSNDSRIRLYDLRDLSLSCKYKGYVNVSSQIKASFSHDGKYIVSGSENQCIYIWKTHHDYSKFSSVRRDRNDFWEGIKAHNAVVTCAVFAPNADNIIKMIEEREGAAKEDQTAEEEGRKGEGSGAGQHTKSYGGNVLVSADFNGCIKVFVNKTKPKHSSLPASALV